jgi:peptide-methionine (S)-S-oxide reductase
MQVSNNFEVATLGGGCFWCTEAIFKDLKGVQSVVSGYAGGSSPDPTYEQICSGRTGHAEVIQVTFNPAIISYEELLYVFWRTHDPTTLNKQGADTGTQYRSVIFYHDELQQITAERSLTETDTSDLWSNPVVTEIAPLDVFYPAEAYHQEYYLNNPYQPYCQVVIDPKVRKFRKSFQDMIQ